MFNGNAPLYDEMLREGDAVLNGMCNLYNMTATVDEMRRVFGSFDGDTTNLPPFDEIFPGQMAPVLRRNSQGGLKLDQMKWGFPGPQAAGWRAVTNVRNLASPFWRNRPGDPRAAVHRAGDQLLRMDRRSRTQAEGVVRVDEGASIAAVCVRRNLADGGGRPLRGLPDVRGE
jgi:hypothetical protein